jgi:hypothetical protein
MWGPLMRLARSRVTIRQMMVLVVVLSVPMALWAWRLRAGFAFPVAFDLIPLAISLVSVFIVTIVLKGIAGDRARVLRPIGWGLLTMNALVAVWFMSVGWSFIAENCVRCGHGWDVAESRFFSFAPRRQVVREYPRGLIELVAADLGIPCTHERRTRGRREHWLGGCICVVRHIGIFRLSDRLWYPPCAKEAVLAWSAADPNFLRNFQASALDRRDQQYIRDLIFRMYDACPADQLPQYPLTRDAQDETATGLGTPRPERAR